MAEIIVPYKDKEEMEREEKAMREIKFRGWSTEMKKWVFGNLLHNELGYFIVNNKKSEVARMVDAERIGQFTNCYDKAGLPIYEGDIVEWDENVADGYWRTNRDAVKFVDAMFYPLTEKWIDDDGKALWLRVIGNIYENKELLEDEL